MLPVGLNDDQANRFADIAGENCLSTSLLRTDDGEWKIQWLFDERPEYDALETRLILAATSLGIALPSGRGINLQLDPVPDVNWLEESYRSFSPFRVGPFYICGTHTTPDPAPDEIVLLIDAATAFGSGEHGTTSGCLMLLEHLKLSGFTPDCVLDMGCGSGILAIGASKLWPSPVLATDIDPECVRVSNHHCRINHVTDQIETIVGDGFGIVTKQYDLIIANILAHPLIDMAEDLMRSLKDGGYVILSGMLQTQAEMLLAHYSGRGAALEHRIDRGEWTALLLNKPA
jgi:ribosomal protein L11 methyltransferase